MRIKTVFYLVAACAFWLVACELEKRSNTSDMSGDGDLVSDNRELVDDTGNLFDGSDGDDDEASDDVEAEDEASVDVEADEPGDDTAEFQSPRPLFELSATTAREGFYDYPYPSDLRRLPSGAPDLTHFYLPDDVPLIPELIEDIHRDIRGFSPSAGIYFRFDAALDPESLPQTPQATLADDATVFVVAIDLDSVDYGRRIPVNVRFRETDGRFWLKNTLVLWPVLGMPLLPGTRYAAIVTRGVRGANGESPAVNPEFDRLFESTPPADRVGEWQLIQALSSWLDAEQLDRPLVATVFTTSDHAEEMWRIRSWLYESAAEPSVTGWQHITDAQGRNQYEGRFQMLDLLAGEPPYHQHGEGVILLDEQGLPSSVRSVDIRFALTVPDGTPPVGGWPLAVYSHGAGGSYHSFLQPEGEDAAQVGVAMISIDNPMNGERDPSGQDFQSYLVEIALYNPTAGRDFYRHGIVDQFQLIRLVTAPGFVVPAEVSHTGQAIFFDTSHLAFVSHSMGSQIGTMLVAVEPKIYSAFFSEGGGGAAAAFLYRKANNVDIVSLISFLLGVDLQDEPMDIAHPVVGLVIQTAFDPADPLNYAYRAIRDPGADSTPKHILMTEGLLDDQTLPMTIEALSSAFGLPIVEPVSHPSSVHELWGIEPVSLPAVENVSLGPNAVTGGVLQFADQGHYAFYRDPNAKAWYKAWLRSGAVGPPVIESLE